MAARSRGKAAKLEVLDEKDFAALEKEEESSAEDLHELIKREKNEFISMDDYLKRRGVK
jgi:hypothetical protein